jgi:hypothetical protein
MGIRAAGTYLVAACVLTWPLVTQLTTRLGAIEGAGDPYLNLWILGWGMQAWLSDPIGVFSGRVFDANIFFPAAGTLTFSDHLLLQSLVLSPLYWLTGNLSLCYNVLLIASLALSGMAMHLLARTVTGSEKAAFIAGLAWACWPYRTAHLLHLQLQSLYFLPLVLWALVRFAAARQRGDSVRLGLFAALQAISSVYYGVMTALAVAVAATALSWSTGQWRSRRYWSGIALAAAIGALVVAPVAWPYFRSQQREGFGRNLFEAARHSATMQSYTQVPHENLVYARSGLLLPRAPSPGEVDRSDPENQMFPGIVLLALAGLGLWKGWRSDAKPLVVMALALAIAGVVLSFGPLGARGLYAWIADHVFGFHAIRAPARFAVIAAAGWCLLAAVGVHRARLRSGVFAAVLALMAIEYLNAPLPLVDAPSSTTRTGAWLRDQPGDGAVLYLPFSIDKEASIHMVQSLEHRRPIVNGYSGQRPAFVTALADAFAAPASVDARATLKEIGVQYVVSTGLIDGADRPDSPYVERETFGDDIVYEIVWTADSEAALDEAVTVTPPAPGPVPFAEGEIATYSVEWLSGPVDLPAGTITLSVLRAEPDDAGLGGEAPAFVFEAGAETAPWLSRFFEARDRFRTSVNAGLLPLMHRRTLREGRRSVDRAYGYDHEGRRVRLGDAPASAREAGALALPLAAHARDALAALWYVRSLPLAAGLAFEMPINEAGRNQVARVVVAGRENVDAVGGSRSAWRLEPTLATRVQRRQAVTATIWLSADEKRVPLVADIEAGFGRLRLKLVDYRP